MWVGILGPLTVTSRGQNVAVTAPTQRALLVLLAARCGENLSTDRIVEALWGDRPPGHPRSTLRFHVSMLRAALGSDGDAIVTRGGGYELDTSRVEIDAEDAQTVDARPPRIDEVAGRYSNVEFDLEQGQRGGDEGSHVGLQGEAWTKLGVRVCYACTYLTRPPH